MGIWRARSRRFPRGRQRPPLRVGRYQWVNGKSKRGFSDQRDWMWGGGVEVGPKDIGLGGITAKAGPRLRLQVETYDSDSIRPMAGVIFHF